MTTTGPSDDLSVVPDGTLRRRYAELDADVDADGAPQVRATELDRLAAELLPRDPSDSALWYDRSMYAKWRAEWPASVEFNEKALELLPAAGLQGEPAAWNLGIAATALGDWARARRAWSAFGIPLPVADSVDAPIDADFGPAPVRLNAEPRFVGQHLPLLDGRTWASEVVWGLRICPARIRIVSVPSPDSGHRHGDVVLHDGDTLGSRRLGEDDLGVFNEIDLWQRSPTPTLTVTIEAPGPQTVEELSDLFETAGGEAEDWTANLQVLCKACSEGTPRAHHDHDAGSSWVPRRQVGLSADLEVAQVLLERWAAAGAGRSFAELDVALP